MKAYRVITDEPQGICIGFKPEFIHHYDEFELVEYDYPAESELYVFINLDSTKMAITTDNKYGHKVDWVEYFEPDLMIWHRPDEFSAWAKESLSITIIRGQ
jgi:hypothetical protein